MSWNQNGGDKYNPRHKTKRRATRNDQYYQQNEYYTRNYGQQNNYSQQQDNYYYNQQSGSYNHPNHNNHSYYQDAPRAKPPMIAQKRRPRRNDIHDSFEDPEEIKRKEEERLLRQVEQKRVAELAKMEARQQRERRYHEQSRRIRNGTTLEDVYQTQNRNLDTTIPNALIDATFHATHSYTNPLLQTPSSISRTSPRRSPMKSPMKPPHRTGLNVVTGDYPGHTTVAIVDLSGILPADKLRDEMHHLVTSRPTPRRPPLRSSTLQRYDDYTHGLGYDQPIQGINSIQGIHEINENPVDYTDATIHIPPTFERIGQIGQYRIENQLDTSFEHIEAAPSRHSISTQTEIENGYPVRPLANSGSSGSNKSGSSTKSTSDSQSLRTPRKRSALSTAPITTHTYPKEEKPIQVQPEQPEEHQYPTPKAVDSEQFEESLRKQNTANGFKPHTNDTSGSSAAVNTLKSKLSKFQTQPQSFADSHSKSQSEKTPQHPTDEIEGTTLNNQPRSSRSWNDIEDVDEVEEYPKQKANKQKVPQSPAMEEPLREQITNDVRNKVFENMMELGASLDTKSVNTNETMGTEEERHSQHTGHSGQRSQSKPKSVQSGKSRNSKHSNSNGRTAKRTKKRDPKLRNGQNRQNRRRTADTGRNDRYYEEYDEYYGNDGYYEEYGDSSSRNSGGGRGKRSANGSNRNSRVDRNERSSRDAPQRNRNGRNRQNRPPPRARVQRQQRDDRDFSGQNKQSRRNGTKSGSGGNNGGSRNSRRVKRNPNGPSPYRSKRSGGKGKSRNQQNRTYDDYDDDYY